MVLPIVAGIAGLALRAAPYAIRGARAVVNPRNLKNYFIEEGLITNKFDFASYKMPIPLSVQAIMTLPKYSFKV